MKRRGLAAVLAVAMTAIIFTGCGGNAASSYQRQAKEQTETSKKEETPAPSSKVEQPASSAPVSEPASSSQPETSTRPEEPAQPVTPAEPEKPAEPAAPEPEPAPPAEPEPQKTNDDTIRPDVKEAIDSYEQFIDRYCEFMAREDYGDMKWLSDYAKWLEDYSKMQKKFDAINDGDLTTAENNYYTEVMLRCSSKLLQTASTM